MVNPRGSRITSTVNRLGPTQLSFCLDIYLWRCDALRHNLSHCLFLSYPLFLQGPHVLGRLLQDLSWLMKDGLILTVQYTESSHIR